MAVYYKFKSARDYDSIPMDGPFISVGTLKEKIFDSKHLGRGTDFDLLVTNAQTNEEYLDEAMLIPKNTSVLIRRVPGRPRLPIVTEQVQKVENNGVEIEPENSSLPAVDTSAMKYSEDSEWDEFGNELYAIPDVLPVQSSNLIPEAPPTTNKADEDSKIKALIDTPALDWQRQGPDGFGLGRGFGRGMGGRMAGGRGFGLQQKTPPQGYVCHRCKVPGHFIQHCPTNGDPNYDIKRVKPPTGIPRSMLIAAADGSYALPTGDVAVLKPNEAAFEKEIEGLPSTRSVSDLPPELCCPLCKDVMKDAVLTSKCCFTSFCDKCIRDFIISKSMCTCGAANILADDLLPNKTLRVAIKRIMEAGNSSADNAGSTFQVQDMESARCPQPKIPSPTSSAVSKGEQKVSPANEGKTEVPEAVDEKKAVSAPQPTLEEVRATRAADVSEATHESMSVKEPASQGSAPLVEEEVQQKLAPSEAAKKKKKKKARLPATDLQWKTPQDFGHENYMMPMGPPPGYNPYWNGMQTGMEGFVAPYAGTMQMMGYGLGPLDMPFGNVMPHDPFGMQNYMLPVVPPPRDLADFSMGMNAPPPIMSREQFEARKADLRRKREIERRGERDFAKDRDFGREVSSTGDVSSVKSKPKPLPPSSSNVHNHHHRNRTERLSPERSSREVEPSRPAKRKSEHHLDRDRERDYDHDRDRESESSSRPSSEPAAKTSSSTTSAAAAAAAAAAAERKHKASVFSRISFPEGEVSKKRKMSTSSSTEPAGATVTSSHHKAASNGYYDDYKSKSSVDYESSDEERHFKRRPSRYEPSPSPPPQGDWEEEGRHKLGAYKYVSELWRKKQSDVMRFLQRVRCWEYRQQPSIVRLTRPTRPDKARRLGYKAKQGYVVYRVRVRRGGRKRPVPKGIVYGKPTNQGVTQLKFQRSKRSVAEERAGRKLGGLRVLNSYWVNEDSTYKYFEIILVDAAHNAIRNDPRINWLCNPVHKHRELRGLTSAGKKYRGLRGRGHLHHKARPSRRATWKRNNTLSLRRYR
ncbi:E3 ubiquitin ligase PQT3-like isoform X1 [Senna tora]|uniref:Ribosomal protein L15 n=1 Tax=Senna tora TaxID=362788 RepID=A0A834STN4_9FABA|nr:E3 ubiquitin ligase PQT3-like isoform X1 [Senna tora]